MSKAGKFEISTEKPYPVWCNLHYQNKFLARFSHEELSDLHYAVEKAMREAKLLLTADPRYEV